MSRINEESPDRTLRGNTGTRPHYISGLSTLIIALACFAWIVQGAKAVAEEARPAALSNAGIEQKLDAQVPLDLEFRDESGATVKLANYFGKRPVILALVYYECPMLCTLTLNGLVAAMKALPFTVGDQYDVVTVSFNPAETPSLAASKKKSYVEEYARQPVQGSWHFLTGQEPSIKRLADSVGFHYRWDPDSKQYAHATGLMILTPQGRIARYFYGVEYPSRDLRLALVEASSGKIGTPVDRVLLFCFHYNPSTGKYTLLVNRLVQAMGVATVLFLSTMIFVLLRMEKMRKGRGTPG